MGLTVPSSGDSDYPTSISDSLTAVDGHDHSSGKGIQITTSGIVDSAITENKIADSAVATAKLANLSVTTGKIAAQAVTQSKIADQAVGTSQLGNGVVVEANIANSNVTPVKLASTYSVQSGNSGTFFTVVGSYVDITNLEVSASSRGRLMFITLGGIGFAIPKLSVNGPPGAKNTGQLRLLKNGNPYQEWQFGGGVTSAPNSYESIIPHTSIFAFDSPSIGTVTYKLQGLVTGGGQLHVQYLALFAFEIF